MLTAAKIDRIKPADQRQEVADGSGLYLIVQPSGAKSFALRFRQPDGKSAKLTLGPFSDKEMEGTPAIGQPLTLIAARQLAAEQKRALAFDRNPAEERRRAKLARRACVENGFMDVARLWVQDYAMRRQRRWQEGARRLGFRLGEDGLEAIEGGLAARWADRAANTIEPDDIRALLAEAHQRGIPGLACRKGKGCDSRKRALGGTLSELFDWLLEQGYIKSDPTTPIKLPKQSDHAPERERVLDDVEVRAFWKAAGEMGPVLAPVLKLLLLTGQRVNEIAQMERRELSADKTMLTLPGSRTKNRREHSVPLVELSRAVLGERLSTNSRHVFSNGGDVPVWVGSKVKAELDRRMAEHLPEGVPFKPFRLHDLRRTAATGMGELGVEPHVIERVLNHSLRGVAKVYNRAKLEAQKRAALDAWADQVARIVA